MPAADAGSPGAEQPSEARPATKLGSLSPADRDALKRELMEEVRRELEKSKAEIDKKRADFEKEVKYAEEEADARNYDAATLKQLQQQVNLLQLDGYFRVRGNIFNNANLGRGPDQTGRYLFPYLTNPEPPPDVSLSTLGAGDMRLRLEPVLHVSDFISLHAQIDVLDNVVFGGDPQTEPFYPSVGSSPSTVTPSILANQVEANLANVKRVWGEVTLPFGQIAFGRMGFHWGEGMFYNDGNCLDCDYGNTFDRLKISSNPIASHVFTLTGDMLGQGVVTDSEASSAYGLPVPTSQLAGAYRFGFQVQRILSDFERKRLADNGQWSFQYGAMGAYRFQSDQQIVQPNGVVEDERIAAQFGEGDVYFNLERRKLRLAGEFAVFGGIEGNRLFAEGVGNTGQIVSLPGQPLNFLQGAGLLRGKYAFLKQDSLIIGLDLGWASGNKQPGMGIRTYANGSGTNGQTVRGDIDGPAYYCPSATSCAGNGATNDITNFRMNPDFRMDELMWRFIFTQISGAYFGRAYIGFKPGGRASGGADDYGLDLNLSTIYSQAIYASETPSGHYPQLGLEIDAGAAFTTREGLFTGFTAGILIPFAGMENYNPPGGGPAISASVGQVYRFVIGIKF